MIKKAEIVIVFQTWIQMNFYHNVKILWCQECTYIISPVDNLFSLKLDINKYMNNR